MRIRTLIIGIITAIGFVFGIGTTATANAAPVHHGSDPYEICSLDPSNGALNECLNNWNNAYGAVKSYAPFAANNSFVVEGVDRCGNGDKTTSGCPVSGAPAGLFVYQIAYGNNTSACIKTDSSGDAVGVRAMVATDMGDQTARYLSPITTVRALPLAPMLPLTFTGPAGMVDGHMASVSIGRKVTVIRFTSILPPTTMLPVSGITPIPQAN